MLVAQADGLEVTERSLQAAAREVETGRDAVTAVADSCGARSRLVMLHDLWRALEGRALVAEVLVKDDTPNEAESSAPEQHHHVIALVWRRHGWVFIDPRSGMEQSVDDALAARLAPEVTELVPCFPRGRAPCATSFA